jgi:hypothetical protein
LNTSRDRINESLVKDEPITYEEPQQFIDINNNISFSNVEELNDGNESTIIR